MEEKEKENTTEVLHVDGLFKNWFLDYSITTSSSTTNPALVKSYVGQATYFVTYLKDWERFLPKSLASL